MQSSSIHLNMFKALVVPLALCVVGVLSAPSPQNQNQKEPVPIISLENDASVDGTFHYKYESGDGTKVEQDGKLKDAVDEEGKPAKAEELTGGFSYVGDDGQTISVSYIADENGYRPQGAHLPTPPPIPADIQRSLDFIATAKPQPQ